MTAPAQVARLAGAAMARGGFVALLVRWKDGTHWIALHADSRATLAASKGSAKLPRGADAAARRPRAVR